MAGSRTALVLIDLQEWIVRDLTGVGGPAAARAAVLASQRSRQSGELVVHVQHLHLDGSDGGAGSDRTRFVDGIEVMAGEPIITKHGRSAFEATELARILGRAGIGKVLLAGVVTEGGVESTAYSALELGYQVAVLSDAVAGHTPAGHEDALRRLVDVGVEILGQEQRGS
jgi:nicotinamidase-related amidase